jgi:hypothetical protein
MRRDDHWPRDHARLDQDNATIGTAAAIRPAMEAYAASAGRICGAQADEGAGDHSGNEQVFHLVSLDVGTYRRTAL